MDTNEFWSIVDHTKTERQNQRRQEAALRARLSVLSPADLAAFMRRLHETLQRAYSWDLWGAAYVIRGGCSDDGFEFFRRWLISRGRADFERVLKDPDSAGDLMDRSEEGFPDFEAFNYVAADLWAEKTGRDAMAVHTDFNAGTEPIGEPIGVPFQEDAAELAKRYPRLWAEFGANPLLG